MMSVNIPMGRLPLDINCYENGLISFDRMWGSGNATLIDQPEVGVQAIITPEDIAIGANTVVEYGALYDYKDMPELLAWLKSLNMEMPSFQ